MTTASSSPRRNDRSSGAFHEVVARHRQQATLRCARNGVTRSTDPLQQGRDAVGRPDLANQIDVTDIDAEFQRCVATSALSVPLLRRCSASMRVSLTGFRDARDLLFAEALAEVPGDSLGHPSRIDEDKRRPMRADQLRETVVVSSHTSWAITALSGDRGISSSKSIALR